MIDPVIVEVTTAGKADQSPVQFITLEQLQYFERIVAAIRAVDTANKELRAAINASWTWAKIGRN